MHRPAVLVILDGWGISTRIQENVLRKTPLPTIEKLNKFYPLTTLQASGISAGLPWGEVGNSEVGHITLGAGKIMYQNLPRISLSIQDKSFFQNPALRGAMLKATEHHGAVHLLGLLGQGSIHSYHDHLYALLELAKQVGVEKLFVHAFTDGRDSLPTSGVESVKKLQEKFKLYGIGELASLCGRNWGMDRNNNWDRVEKSYRALAEGQGETFTDPVAHLEKCYAASTPDHNSTDEYIEPALAVKDGQPIGVIHDGDAVIFFNFREDRAREITKAFVLPGFDKFPRSHQLKLEFVTMTEYEKDLPVSIAFPKESVETGLGGVIAKRGLKQLRLAETEKYAHVTYFFNGGKEEPWQGEDRMLVPSPSVSSFDQTPEMSAPQITEKAIEAVQSGKYDFILINYANADMVGHTGIKEACVEAVKAVDNNLAILIPTVLKAGGALIITADHGNVEEIRDPRTGEMETEHSTNPVPCWYVTPENHYATEKNTQEISAQENEIGGLLSDVAPTILDIMGIPKSEEMTGESLLPTLK